MLTKFAVLAATALTLGGCSGGIWANNFGPRHHSGYGAMLIVDEEPGYTPAPHYGQQPNMGGLRGQTVRDPYTGNVRCDYGYAYTGGPCPHRY